MNYVPEGLAMERPLPKTIRVDNAPEFTSRTLDQWAYADGVTLGLIFSQPLVQIRVASRSVLSAQWFTTFASIDCSDVLNNPISKLLFLIFMSGRVAS